MSDFVVYFRGQIETHSVNLWEQVLGTDGGGTREIVEQNVSGLFHPMGRAGNWALAENLRYMLKNPTARKQMGKDGRKKVGKQYLKRHMYERLVEVLTRCMRRQVASSRSLIGF